MMLSAFSAATVSIIISTTSSKVRIAICSGALGRPVQNALAVLGEISITGTILKVEDLANVLQVCLDSGAKRVLLPVTSAPDMYAVPPELVSAFNILFYSTPQEAVFKALGVD